jgi:membrane-associated phospholipid phosphatase
LNTNSVYRNSLRALTALAFATLAHAAVLGQVPSPTEPEAPPGQQVPDGNQNTSQDVNAAKPAQAGGSIHFLRILLRDQKAIFGSPLAIKRRDAKWLVPLATATAVLIATDRRASDELTPGHDPLGRSKSISSLGSGYVTFGTAGSIFALGALTHHEHLRETGALGLEALIDSAIVGGVMKAATGRQRPSQGDGDFWRGGNSFPSGHTITAWALATVVAEQYHDKPLVRIGAYGIAAAIGVSRFTAGSHYPSDVLVGGSLGYLIGRYVVRAHGKDAGRRSPLITPYVNHPTRTVGARVSLPL